MPIGALICIILRNQDWNVYQLASKQFFRTFLKLYDLLNWILRSHWCHKRYKENLIHIMVSNLHVLNLQPRDFHNAQNYANSRNTFPKWVRKRLFYWYMNTESKVWINKEYGLIQLLFPFALTSISIHSNKNLVVQSIFCNYLIWTFLFFQLFFFFSVQEKADFFINENWMKTTTTSFHNLNH